MLSKIWRSLAGEEKIDMLRIPRGKETHGILLLGDPGSGKSQTVNQIIYQARQPDRKEPGVCYDPAAEFVQTHYQDGLDFILNPLDQRFPNWQLASEIETASDLDLIAESFIPVQHVFNEQAKFFNRAAQDVFKLILAKRWTNEKIIKVLSDNAEIDRLVEGTEVAQKIDPKAGPQRAGVLGTLADVAKALKYIPAHSDEKRNFSLTNWVKGKRKSWLFLTTTSDTRDALRPLQSAMLNILMRRLMSIPQAARKNDAWWFVADELHSLNALSALPEFVAECRKHGIRYVLGTQNKHQISHKYGEEAKTMLASPILKIFYRCNEPETARWISECIGSEERVMPRVSSSVAFDEKGRQSNNYSNEVVARTVVSREQIMGLPDLHGYWKFENTVVPFVLSYNDWNKINPDFMPRKIEFENSATRSAPAVVERKTDARQPKQNTNSPKPPSDGDKRSNTAIPSPHHSRDKTKSNEINLDF